MDLRKIKKLIDLLENSALTEMEITEGENTIRLSRAAMRAPPSADQFAPQSTNQNALHAGANVAPGLAADAPVADNLPIPGRVIESPLVGTFFNSPSPEDKPYITLGSTVAVGDTLCLIEAMKTFNQLDAEIAGVVTVIHKSNGDPVEYGEPLFVIQSSDDSDKG